MAKVILALLLVGFAIQISTTDHVAQNVGGIIDEAQKLIEAMEKVVEKASDVAFNQIKSLLYAFQNSINAIVNTTFPLIQDIIDKLLEQLKNMERAAAAAGIDALECTKGRDKEITNLAVGFKNCSVFAIHQAEHIITNAIARITDIVGIGPRLIIQLNNCRKNLATLPICVAKITAETTKDTVEIPKNIIAIVEGVKADLASLKFSTEVCFALEFLQVPVEGAIILGKVGYCIVQKMNNDTITDPSAILSLAKLPNM